MEEPHVYTVTQAAKRYSICRLTVLRKLNSGELKGFKLGAHWRIKAEDLKVLEEKKVA